MGTNQGYDPHVKNSQTSKGRINKPLLGLSSRKQCLGATQPYFACWGESPNPRRSSLRCGMAAHSERMLLIHGIRKQEYHHINASSIEMIK